MNHDKNNELVPERKNKHFMHIRDIIKCCDDALKINPKNVVTLYNMGKCFLEQENINLVYNIIEKIKSIDDKNSFINILEGHIYLKKGCFVEAYRQFLQSFVNIKCNDVFLSYGIGILFEAMENFNLSKIWYKHILQTNIELFKFLEITFRLAVCFKKENQLIDALDCFYWLLTSIKFNYFEHEVELQIAHVFERLNEIEKCLEILNKLKCKNKNVIMVNRLYSWVLFKTGHFNKLKELFKCKKENLINNEEIDRNVDIKNIGKVNFEDFENKIIDRDIIQSLNTCGNGKTNFKEFENKSIDLDNHQNLDTNEHVKEVKKEYEKLISKKNSYLNSNNNRNLNEFNEEFEQNSIRREFKYNFDIKELKSKTIDDLQFSLNKNEEFYSKNENKEINITLNSYFNKNQFSDKEMVENFHKRFSYDEDERHHDSEIKLKKFGKRFDNSGNYDCLYNLPETEQNAYKDKLNNFNKKIDHSLHSSNKSNFEFNHNEEVDSSKSYIETQYHDNSYKNKSSDINIMPKDDSTPINKTFINDNLNPANKYNKEDIIKNQNLIEKRKDFLHKKTTSVDFNLNHKYLYNELFICDCSCKQEIKDTYIVYLLGRIYALEENFDMALEIFNICIKLDQNAYEVYNSIGVIHFNKCKYDTALTYFQKSFFIKGYNNVALENINKTEYKLKNPNSHSKVTDVNPDIFNFRYLDNQAVFNNYSSYINLRDYGLIHEIFPYKLKEYL